MKLISQLSLVIMFLVVAVAGADESDFDAPDRRERPQQRESRRPQLPPPLRIFDEDDDGALSPEEIQKLADKLNALDQDGDGRVDPRELEGIFSGHRDHGPRSRDEFDRDAFDDRSDRRRDGPPPEGRRRRPPDRENDRLDRDEFDDRSDRRPEGPPQEGRRRRPPDRENDRFDRDEFDRDAFDQDEFDQDAFDDRSDRRRDGPPPEGRRRRPPGREDDRFDREDSDPDTFDDEFDPHREPPPRRGPVDEDRGRNDRPHRRDEPGSGNDRLIDRLYRYDTDGDGKLSADELPARAQWLIEQADADLDGSVDRRELENFLSNR